jgi:hypothetical protein
MQPCDAVFLARGGSGLERAKRGELAARGAFESGEGKGSCQGVRREEVW